MFPTAHTSLIDLVETKDLSALLCEAGESVAYLDTNWVVQFCNDVYLNRAGLSRSEVIGKTPFDFLPTFKRSIFFEVFESCRVNRKPTSRIAYSTVHQRWLMARAFPVGDGFLMMANDASESVVKQYQLAQKIVMDPLTDRKSNV